MSLLSQIHPTSDSGLTISLHPLILLTISDYITRHTLRNLPRPIVGALLGQQHGRSITLEHAFECETIEGSATMNGQQVDETSIRLNEAWFKDRLQQYKDVHKAPALELMGWFTTTPLTGPQAAQLPIHQQILEMYNETAVLLAFHPMSVLQGAGVGGKLPLTIYESVYESVEEASGAGAGAGAMDVDTEGGQESARAPEARLHLRFRELPYSIETGEAEMIGVGSVASGGGNAADVEARDSKTTEKDQKAKKTNQEVQNETVDKSLSADDEELIASLTARVNAVKMLHARISLLKSYLSSLPPSYLTSTTSSTTAFSTISQAAQERQIQSTAESQKPEEEPNQEQNPNHPFLRSISALLSRLPLLLPPSPTSLTSFTSETLTEKSDVELVSLLGALGKSVNDARELGRKFGIVDNARAVARRNNAAAAGGGGGGGRGMLSGTGKGGGSGGMDVMMDEAGGEGMHGPSGDIWGYRGGGGGGGEGRVWGNGFASG